MAVNYAKKMPQDENNAIMDGYCPPFPALQANTSENATVSSTVNFTDSTTLIEVTTVGAAAVIKWIGLTNTNPSVISAAGTANYDNVIATGSTRRFVVPRENQAIPSIVGRNIQEGLYRMVAIKSMGIGSVLLSQF